MRWVLLALLLTGCSRPASSIQAPKVSSRTWATGRMYFYGHEILAPLTLTKHDSSLTIQGFHRTRSGKLERTPELALMEFHPAPPVAPPSPDAKPDSNYMILSAAGSYGVWARKGGASARVAADSVVAFLLRSDRVKEAVVVGGPGLYVAFKNGEILIQEGSSDHPSVPAKPAVLIDGDFRDLSRYLENGTLVFFARSGRMYLPDGQRQYSDSLLRNPSAEVKERLRGLSEYLDDSVPLDRLAWRHK